MQKNMSLVEKYQFLGSSVDPKKLSNTIQSGLTIVVTALAYFGVVLPLEDIQPIISAVGSVVVALFGVYNSLKFIVAGLVRIKNNFNR